MKLLWLIYPCRHRQTNFVHWHKRRALGYLYCAILQCSHLHCFLPSTYVSPKYSVLLGSIRVGSGMEGVEWADYLDRHESEYGLEKMDYRLLYRVYFGTRMKNIIKNGLHSLMQPRSVKYIILYVHRNLATQPPRSGMGLPK